MTKFAVHPKRSKRIYNCLKQISEDVMPLVNIEIIKGQNDDYKQTLLKTCRKTITEVLQISDHVLIQHLIESEQKDWDFDASRSERFTVINVSMYPGRNSEIKRKLIERLFFDLQTAVGIQKEDLFIVLSEPPRSNWGVSGGQVGGE